MVSPAELSPDPRLRGKTGHYDRDEIASQLGAFYKFLPHIPLSSIHRAPPEGWPSITAEVLEKRGIHKTPEAVELLRHLPYIEGDHPWIAPEAFPCDYRILGGQVSSRDTPGWVQDVQQDSGNVTSPDGSPAGVEKWPPWVVQLTTGTDREGSCYMLDTTDGTVTKYCAVGYLYEPTYNEGDPRAWRDRLCGEDTVTLVDQVNTWRREYHQLRYLGIPDAGDGNGYPSLHFHREEDGPDSYDWKETEELRSIYRKHGWPDNYDKETCREALKAWYLAQ
ncbi:hypothetical protein PFICI_08017 [Pestalotiopsis fici W106-1]|uniref:Uncharacterized protein n=1 Tax=Pestalotiopsis fici (strain W106-1 / CGMCC3.15140) TaxID=1229662 RepID=W3X2W3_PESFW|nr:uncharacterized protein PFICI_08017 [Pestalotiopsis fici W106-1]ETS80488.1 hypothetical protein PFICI_08017 [Pestalotiopsis fici W106-1]